jgi:hypothetical protein
LPDARKERIYKVLSDLFEEVSKDRSRLEVISTLLRNMAGLSKEGADGAKPWADMVAKILLAFNGKLYEAKEDETKQLPRSEERKRLPPPDQD